MDTLQGLVAAAAAVALVLGGLVWLASKAPKMPQEEGPPEEMDTELLVNKRWLQLALYQLHMKYEAGSLPLPAGSELWTPTELAAYNAGLLWKELMATEAAAENEG